jgi:protein-tyrosine kinase
MEKIKDALAKARLQNAQAKPSTIQAATIQPANNIEPRTNPVDYKPLPNITEKEFDEQKLSNSFSNTENELDKIKYNDTQVIKLDPTHLEKYRIVSHIKNDINSGVFDSLRTQVLKKMEENNWRTLAVVSPTPESGKTLVSINLAMSIAQQPQKTAILVDFDLRRPKVATYLGLHAEKSINDYLQDKAQLQEIMINPGISRLVVMPTMRPVTRSSETLSSKKITNLIQELRDRYDSRIVIFDLPPVLNTDDAMVILPQVDCVLLVVASGMSTQSEIEETLYHLPKEKLIGVVFNKADVESKAYYY